MNKSVYACIPVHVCIPVCACIPVHVCIPVCACIPVHVCILVCACIPVHVCILVCACIPVHVCILVCACIPVHVCIPVCACIPVHVATGLPSSSHSVQYLSTKDGHVTIYRIIFKIYTPVHLATKDFHQYNRNIIFIHCSLAEFFRQL